MIRRLLPQINQQITVRNRCSFFKGFLKILCFPRIHLFSQMSHLRCIPGVLENNQIVTVQTNGPLLFVFAKQILHNVRDAQTAMMTAFGKQFGHPVISAEIIAKKAQQRMFFLRQLKKFRVNKTILTQFYQAVTESVLTFSITVWFGSASIHNKNMLEGIVKTASKITGSKLPSIESIYTTRTLRKATTIISDCTHPANHLFESLPSGKRFRSIKTRNYML